MAFIKYRISTSATVPTSTTAKGSPLTNLEVDGNFKSLSDAIDTINSTVTPISLGGTGSNTANSARTALSAAGSGANSDITSLTGLTTPLSVGQGGTGANFASLAPFALKGANADITSLTGLTTPLSVGQGGTGVSSTGAAVWALKGANSDITSLSGLTTPLSISQGGTGATTTSGLRVAIGAAASGANSDITSLTGYSGNFVPTTNNTQMLGSVSFVWNTIYGTLFTGTSNSSYQTAIIDTYGNGKGLFLGNGDNASSTVANIQVRSSFGIGFSPSISDQIVPLNENAVWINVRNGDIGGRGSLTMSGNVTAYSDARLKTNLHVIENAVDKVCALVGYTYDRTDIRQRQTGILAQDLQKVLPEAVDSTGEYLSVAYGNLVGLLIESIKELKKEIEDLKGNR